MSEEPGYGLRKDRETLRPGKGTKKRDNLGLCSLKARQ